MGLLNRFTGLFRRNRLERDLDEELQFHIELKTQDNIAAGMPPEEARYAALRAFGGVAQKKEECRDAWGVRFINELRQDLRYGLRQLRRNPGFTAVAILTLALGIGANTAIFSVVNATLFQPLPFHNPNRIVWIRPKGRGVVSPVDFLDWKRQNHAFSQISAYFSWGANLDAGGRPQRITRTVCSTNLFNVLGVRPTLGRSFLPREEKEGHAPVAILSHSLWQRSFSSSPGALGKSVSVNGRSYTIVGVMPAGFNYPGQTDLWTPPALEVPAPPMNIGNVTTSHISYLNVIGRLAPNVTIDQARAEMDTIATRIAKQYDEGPGNHIVLVQPLKQVMVGNTRPLLLILLGAVGLVLLIACTNVANLMLCRARMRRTEMAVRSALGATGLRLVRQTLTESVLLALAGGALGLLFSVVLTHLLLRIGSEALPAVRQGHIDGIVLGFALGISMLSGILFGLAPALGLARVNLGESLNQIARRGYGDRGLLRASLAVSEIALALILLIGAGLLLRSFISLTSQVRLGFNPRHVLSLSVVPTDRRYQKATQKALFYRQALEHLRALPGVTAAGIVNSLPPYSVSTGIVNIAEHPSSRHLPKGVFSVASPGYFRALQIPVLRGRVFSVNDNSGSSKVAVINQTLAQVFFPHQDPVGKHVAWFTGNSKTRWLEIIGVVGNVKNSRPGVAAMPQVYASYTQEGLDAGMSFVVRTASSPVGMASAVRTAIQSADADIPVFNVEPLSQALAQTLLEPRFTMLLLGLFSVLATVLAAIGIYGVVSYSVSRRTHEIGIRMAVGAQRSDVLKMVVRQGVALALTGIAIGIAGAFMLTHFLAHLLYGVTPTDPLTFIAVSLILIAVALLACYIPARRAAKVDPMVALRYE